MVTKPIDPKETYVVREVFSCGAGHTPGIRFTHWEQGECCPLGGHDGVNPHFYWRKLLVPLKAQDEKTDLWSLLHTDEYENFQKHGGFGQFPLAPEGLNVGQKISPLEGK